MTLVHFYLCSNNISFSHAQRSQSFLPIISFNYRIKRNNKKHFHIIFQLPNLLRCMSNPVLSTKYFVGIVIRNNLRGAVILD